MYRSLLGNFVEREVKRSERSLECYIEKKDFANLQNFHRFFNFPPYGTVFQVEQITAEYKVLALQYHPDKNEGDKEAERKFQQLKHAKEVLCDPEQRSNYDKWRRSGIAISYKQWVGMKDHVHQRKETKKEDSNAPQSMHWSTPKTKDRMLQDASGEAAGSPGHTLGKAQPTNAHRRASEGGANIYYGARRDLGWDSEAPSEVVNKVLWKILFSETFQGVLELMSERIRAEPLNQSVRRSYEDILDFNPFHLHGEDQDWITLGEDFDVR
ncbi:J domain-containing protein [Melipona quadrifasciata]|uniref:J domain-containing protein n=1 Tax=Melipona quadrifasciata TaxID=166423 RepID=A0A0M8ZXB1_9HYME|nr:J domain-containing protein [Melipona quadrifasciata]